MCIRDSSSWLESSGDVARFDVATAMLEDFDAIDELTGWPRSAMASLLGCKHPDPEAWLSVDIGELKHSQTVVRFIREVAAAAAEADPQVRVDSILALAPSVTAGDAGLIASREVSRSAIRLCKDLLRRARGSTYAIRHALADGKIIALVADDLPGDALLLGYELLAPRSFVTAQIESSLGSIALAEIPEDAPVSETLDEARAELRAGLNLPK